MLISKSKFNDLIKRIDRLEQLNRCAQKQHDWEMIRSFPYNGTPIIWCRHCYAVPEKDK